MATYFITTKSNVSFALLGQSANRAEARQMAKDLGGTVRTEAEYNTLASDATAAEFEASLNADPVVAAAVAQEDAASAAANARVAEFAAEIAEREASSVFAFEVHGLTHCPSCGAHLSNGVGEHNQEVNGKKVKHDQFEFECLACGTEFGPAIAKKSAPAGKGTRAPVVNTSTAERPCKLVWQIADDVFLANPDAKRAEVLAECTKQGVAFYTARTQYQQWLGVRKEMAAREAAQAAKKGA